MTRKTRSDKGKKRKYPKNRKSPRPHKVRSHDKGNALKLGPLLTDEDKDALKFDEIDIGSITVKRKKK